MDTEIKKYVSRYVIPFYYSRENKGYEEITDFFRMNKTDNQSIGLPKDGKWIESGFWENRNSDKTTITEMDLYSYLPTVFQENRSFEQEDVRNLGISYLYRTNGKLLELVYQKGEALHPFFCKNLGVLLFKNEIGFVWYEIEFKKDIDVDSYISFQKAFKELARPNRIKKKPIKGNAEEQLQAAEECDGQESSDSFWTIKEIEDQGNNNKELFWKKTFNGQVAYAPFCMGEWITSVLSADKLGIHFWAERYMKRKTEGVVNGNAYEIAGKVRVPDKALLFQYLFITPTEEKDRNNLIFHVTNGYDKKYLAPDNLESKLYMPFGNTCFYITNGGMACVATQDSVNEQFFSGQFSERIKRDYFFIYLLLAYQTYSCAHYSWRLTKLPADEKAFQSGNDYTDQLETLHSQINLFLVKSVFESVSNIHHQNGVYRYGKKELHINEDIQSLTVGLGALQAVEQEKKEREKKLADETRAEEQEKRDRKVEFAVIVFGLMMVVSAWIDGLNLVEFFKDCSAKWNAGHTAVSIFIVGLTLYLVYILFVTRRRRKRKNR